MAGAGGFRHCFGEEKAIGWALKFVKSLKILKW